MYQRVIASNENFDKVMMQVNQWMLDGIKKGAHEFDHHPRLIVARARSPDRLRGRRGGGEDPRSSGDSPRTTAQ